jgi:predicted enzyme related to lactoylglutathione lyase
MGEARVWGEASGVGPGVKGIATTSPATSVTYDMERSLAFYRDILGFSAKTSFLLDGLRFAMLETGNDVYIELVEMKQPMQPVGDSELFWHLALRTDHLEKSLEAAVNVGVKSLCQSGHWIW